MTDEPTLSVPEYLMLAGVVGVVGGTLLPWEVTAEGATLGFGANGFFAVFAALAVLATVGVMQGTDTTGRVALGGGLVAVLIAGHWLVAVAGLANAGVGVFVSLLGAVALLVGGALRLRRSG